MDKKICGFHNSHELRQLKKVVKKIESYRESFMKLSNEELQEKTFQWKEQVKNGLSLTKILPEAYAVVREASRRVLGLEPYSVQLIGGILLYQGRIAEMMTGEGKTLVAAMPSYLMALTGRGVHVVTVNDYLAERDAKNIGRIHEFLGLSVGCVLNDSNRAQRQHAYNCDITYVTNHELGFDYLRDNMVNDISDRVQRGLHFAIIDEVDSILIDEARTPLIISGAADTPISLYERCCICVNRLKEGTGKELTKLDIMNGVEIQESGDYIVDRKDKLVHLTEDGVKKVESFFDLSNLADMENMDIQHHIQMALKAKALMHKDHDYVVINDAVQIVDEFTGRILDGRRYSDGLHQAIEAKEHVTIQKESQTMATITYQSFFNLYEKKSGMTGTAMTEVDEFRSIYHMDVVSVPTNKPMIRKDLPDCFFKTKQEKYQAIIEKIMEVHVTGQPILVGTSTIDVSEHLSELLNQQQIEHQVLNAKYHEQEADIISHAGEHNSVTIATNMAGRGTDIQLDDMSVKLGGLFVIGAQRHESRRIDNQLKGRSGRQGDPGCSQFFISLEDDLMKLFGSDRILKLLNDSGVNIDNVSYSMLSKGVVRAQRNIESHNFEIRRNLLKYDEVNHAQRDLVYRMRNSILSKDNLSNVVYNMIDEMIQLKVNQFCQSNHESEWDMDGLLQWMHDICPEVHSFAKDVSSLRRKDVVNTLQDVFHQKLCAKQSEFGEDMFLQIESVAMLRALDRKWIVQLNDLEYLKQGVGLVGYGQKDPVVEYKKQAFVLFSKMQSNMEEDAVRMIMHAHYVQPVLKEDMTETHEM